MLKKIFWLALALFLAMNLVAGFHAYKFTHFDATAEVRTADPTELSLQQKAATLVFGVSNPRPRNKFLPDQAFETILLQSDVQLEAWLIKTRNAKGTVIVFHGFSGEKSSMLDKAAVFRELGYHTLLVDFRGSGGSEGNQTTIGYKEAADVKAAVSYLEAQGEKNIIIFGTSMGSVAIMKALHESTLPVTAIILECPFGTMLETVQERFKLMQVPSFPMAHLLVFWGGTLNGFNAYQHNPVQYATNIRCPTLLLWGEQDDKVSHKQIQEIYANLGGPKKLSSYQQSGHNIPLEEYRAQWTADVQQFLDSPAAP